MVSNSIQDNNNNNNNNIIIIIIEIAFGQKKNAPLPFMKFMITNPYIKPIKRGIHYIPYLV